MIFLNEKEELTNEQIAEWADLSAKLYTEKAGKQAVSSVKIRIAVEEMLLKFRECYGTEHKCRILGRKRFGQISFELRQKGVQMNPIAQEDEMQLPYDILSKLKVTPHYSFSTRKGVNSVSIPCEKKPAKNKLLIMMLFAVVLAVVFHFGLQALGATGVSNTLFESITKPVFDKITNVIAAIATPLVFLAVITGIIGLGDVSSFGKIGTRFCGAMGITYLISSAALAISGAVAYPPQAAAAGEQKSVLAQLMELVLDIIPNNLVEPFSIDNDLQVITIAIFVGTVMLILGSSIKHINSIIFELSNIVNRMMLIVCKLLPFVVFLGIFNLLHQSKVSDFISIYKMFICFIVASSVLVIITIIRALIVTRVSFGTLFKKMLPTLTINITTSSQVAALSENINCCKNKFGIDGKLVDFALPLGIVVYMPAGAIFLGLTALSLAAVSGTAITLSAFIKVAIVSVILAIAAPPIPGSAFAVLPILFTACGIPSDVYPLAVVIGTIIGYLLPAYNGFLLQLELLMSAVKMKKIDMNVLRNKKAAE